jgi:hypothetical protein
MLQKAEQRDVCVIDIKQTLFADAPCNMQKKT